MPASNEHALGAAQMLESIKNAIRIQLFGLTNSTERLPIRINFQQEGGKAILFTTLTRSGEFAW